jgi:predicted S18 family serine protease
MYVIKNFYILKIITMKKIFTLLLIFSITLSSSFAATGLKTTLNSDDLLSAKIFYIN